MKSVDRGINYSYEIKLQASRMNLRQLCKIIVAIDIRHIIQKTFLLFKVSLLKVNFPVTMCFELCERNIIYNNVTCDCE